MLEVHGNKAAHISQVGQKKIDEAREARRPRRRGRRRWRGAGGCAGGVGAKVKVVVGRWLRTRAKHVDARRRDGAAKARTCLAQVVRDRGKKGLAVKGLSRNMVVVAVALADKPVYRPPTRSYAPPSSSESREIQVSNAFSICKEHRENILTFSTCTRHCMS
ncbi:hypothetical protein E2C01_028101 [Portunus trituberculatus]|uniref:Uncharacterized protein n=1 Tax=Portunus trituberculatus TaxID=210409 RepID=A0A5B7EJS7_PORTR|nr:hypothetical protein [Portunus trituberculatus]